MKKILLLLLSGTSLFAGTVRLHNDSPYKLRAVIRASDGTYMGEMVVLPMHYSTWNGGYASFGPHSNAFQPNPAYSQTPYMVHWLCLDGDEFGVSSFIPSGGLAIAENSDGVRYCKPPPKKPPSPYGPLPNDEQLHYQNEAPAAEGSQSQSASQ
ncbi:MAG: hypothetical protein JSS30_00570 [Verrucomicrobia bacterium]|nr:hypothetical protein [Verrucomicrobiota bacterium]